MARDAGESMYRIIDTIAGKKIQNAQFNKTIQATVVSCLDSTIGKYKVKYQDGYWYAYSQNIDVTYPNGTYVYILIPEGNFSKDKYIIGTVEKHGTNYIPISTDSDYYLSYDFNILENKNLEYILNSYQSGSIVFNFTEEEGIKIAEELKQDNAIRLLADFKTNLTSEHINNNGDYGIELALDFYKESTQGQGTENDIVTQTYTLNTFSFKGNPYVLSNYTTQYQDFIIDTANLVRVKSFTFFVKDFIPQSEDIIIEDIFIKNIQLVPCHYLSDKEKDGVTVRLTTPQGTLFDTLPQNWNTLSEEEKTGYLERNLIASIYVNGRLVNLKEQSVDFYWFKQNPGVTSNSLEYSKYGGNGWACLNPYIERADGTIRNYNAGINSYTINREDVKYTAQNVYKCVAVYNRGIYSSNEVTIRNKTAAYQIYVSSDRGDHFSLGYGYPTLTCFLSPYTSTEVIEDDNLIYHWQVKNYKEQITALPESSKNNDLYNKAINLLSELEADETIYQNKEINQKAEYGSAYEDIFNTQDVTVQEAKDHLNELINNLNQTQRVEGHILHNVDINQIVNQSTYTCGVYTAQPKEFIGAAAITLTNDSSPDVGFSLVINNGTQVFKYNEAGISPTAQSKQTHQTIDIPELSFIIYDNQGKPIDQSIANKSKIRWYIPSENSLLTYNRVDGDEFEPIEERYVNHNPNLSYKIKDNYDVTLDRNDIILQVDYGGLTLTTSTNFTFLKVGENGTNGTDFVCKIDVDGDKVYYPTLYLNQAEENGIEGCNWTSNKSYKVVGTLFKDNQPIINSQNLSFRFNILATGVDHTTGGFGLVVNDNLSADDNWAELQWKTGAKVLKEQDPAVDIVQVEARYEGKKYYATLPIVISKGTDNHRINIKPHTGFKYAVYKSDGTYPEYDNRMPFEVIVEQKLNNNIWEDITTMKNSDGSNKVTYTWRAVGNIAAVGVGTHKASFKPADVYNGMDTCNGVYCKAIIGNDEVQIYIPISLYLNRYGQNYLNDWDGNSIQIDNDGGVILTPLVGAGKKDEDNSFTGVLMGAVNEGDKEEIGLFGYNKGQRSIFLDSETGKAEFGKNSSGGRIIIDPSQNIDGQAKALLYSNNYPIDAFLSDPYVNSIKNSNGLIIDLSTPQIGFGSGHFYVTDSGNIHAAGGGDIAGWQIGTDSIHKDTDTTHVGMRSGISNDVNVNTPSGAVSKARAFYAGLNNNFYVTHDGYLRASQATIGSGNNLIYIGSSGENGENSALFTYGKGSKNANLDGFYIGTDGFGLGLSYKGVNPDNTNQYISAFQVDDTGKAWFRQGHIGDQNGWTITNSNNLNALYTGTKSTFNSNVEGLFLSPSGIKLGSNFSVDSAGYLISSNGKIGGWDIGTNAISNSTQNGGGITLSADGSIQSKNYDNTAHTGWSIDPNGSAVFYNINATGGGQIGDWTINSGSLKSNGITISGNTIQANNGNWKINADGTASFNDIQITGQNSKWTQGTISSGSINTGANGVTASGGANAGSLDSWARNQASDEIQSQLLDNKNANKAVFVSSLWAKNNVRGSSFSIGEYSGAGDGTTIDCFDYNIQVRHGLITSIVQNSDHTAEIISEFLNKDAAKTAIKNIIGGALSLTTATVDGKTVVTNVTIGA